MIPSTVDIWLADTGRGIRQLADRYMHAVTGDRHVDAGLVELHAVLALKRGCRRGQ